MEQASNDERARRWRTAANEAMGGARPIGLAMMAVADAEQAELRAALLRVRALADAFADDGLSRHGGNIAWHIEEAIANEKGDFPDAADRRIASQRARAEAAEAKVARVEALVEQWDGATEANEDAYPVHARVMQVNIAELRAALGEPAQTCDGQNGCCSCCGGAGQDVGCQGMCWDCHGTGHPHELKEWRPTQKCSGGMDSSGMKTECSQPHMHKGPHDEIQDAQ